MAVTCFRCVANDVQLPGLIEALEGIETGDDAHKELVADQWVKNLKVHYQWAQSSVVP